MTPDDAKPETRNYRPDEVRGVEPVRCGDRLLTPDGPGRILVVPESITGSFLVRMDNTGADVFWPVALVGCLPPADRRL